MPVEAAGINDELVLALEGPEPVEMENPELGVKGLAPGVVDPSGVTPNVLEVELLNPNAGDEEKEAILLVELCEINEVPSPGRLD